jgi:eukaryotic-like serine/threonine-protein kinase
MAEDPLELIGVTLGEHFRVDSFTDEGELSVTYKGHDLRSNASVAVRCLNLPMTLDPALAGPFVESFLERTRLHRRLAPGHSSFVQVLAGGVAAAPRNDRKIPYEVREWLDAMTFATYSAKRRSEGHEGWPLADVLRMLDPVAAGLGYLHDVGVTHGEINPNNLLVVEVGRRPILKIVDFGGAGAVSDKSGARPVLRVLVPDYAAPELVDKHLGAIGTWTDVFSLAVIVLECLAGTLATRNVAASVIVDPKHRPSAKKLGLDLPERVDDVLERALASEPSRRPKNVAAFWRELKAAAAAPATLSASPRPPPLPVRSPAAPPSARNPLMKATLVGLQPTQPREVERSAPMFPAEFSADEAPTKRRDEPALVPAIAALPPPPAEDPLADMPSAPVPDEPEVFRAALGRPSIWVRMARAPVVVGASVLGGLVVVALCVVLFVGRRSPAPVVVVVAAPEAPAAAIPPAASVPVPAPPPPAPPATAVDPPASAPTEIASEAPSARPAPSTAPMTTFRRANANAAIAAAGGDLSDCKGLGTIRGSGSVRVAFNWEGGVAQITIGPPYANTQEGACIRERFGKAQMAPFRGPPGAVNYVFTLSK